MSEDKTPFLSKEDEEYLRELHRTIKEKRIAYRINAILLLNQGYSKTEIEKILLIDRNTILSAEKKFRKGGIEKLIKDEYVLYEGKLTSVQKEMLICSIRENLYLTSQAVRNFIKKEFGVKYSIDGTIKLLHSLGFSYKKAKAIPAKANLEEQEIFISKYEELRENIGQDEKIYFLDAVHPVHNSMPAYGWIETGKEKEVKSNPGRKRMNINGVYSPVDHEIIVSEESTINFESNIRLFRKIENKHPDLKKIYIIHDNARYNWSKDLREYLLNSRIVMVPLPPYSPNLNLIERLWKLMKKQVLYNRYFEDYLSFRKAIKYFFNTKLKNDHSILKTLMTENFHLFQKMQT